MDVNRDIEWQKTIGGNDIDYLITAVQTSDGGYLLGGYSYSNISGEKTENSLVSGYTDYWVVKLDPAGNIVWDNTIGGNRWDFLYSIVETNDGGYLLGGESTSDISGDKTENSVGVEDYWVIKLDATGNIVWQKTIGGTGFDHLYCLTKSNDGGFLLAGMSSSNISGDKTENLLGISDYWVVKLDSAGIILWQNTIGGNNWDLPFSVIQTSDGGYLLGGSSESNISGDKTENSLGYEDYWVIKLDAIGNIVWQNTIGGSGNDSFKSLIETSDGGFLIGGQSNSAISGDKTDTIGGWDWWIIKLDVNGDMLWQKTIGGTDNEGLAYTSLVHTTDGGYLIGGESLSDISGDKSENSRGGADYWIVKLGPDSTLITSEKESIPGITSLTLYPNPASELLNLELEGKTQENYQIFDLQGKVVLQGVLNLGKNMVNIASLAKGSYVIRTESTGMPFEVLR